MRVVVISDSHRNPQIVKDILRRQKSAEVVIFCGDGEEDFVGAKAEFPEKSFHMVRGNCDFGSMLNTTETITLEGVKFFFTHGHMYNVKSSLYEAKQAARSSGANVLLYGHTHIAKTEYEDGLYIMNPGSCGEYQGTYGVVDITPKGIVTVLMKV